MPRSSSRRALLILITATSVNSCSGQVDDRGASAPAEAARVFGTEDRRAAQALSVGSSSVLNPDQSPYERAISCQTAVDAIAPRLTSTLPPEQLRAVKYAQRQLAERVRQQGAAAGKDAATVAKELSEVSGRSDDLVLQTRVALACLRELQ